MERHRKRELRDLNLRVWAGEQDVFTVQKSLDSSMKKNTAFIKRLRTGITPAGQATFLQEIRTLSLHKYLSEIISACFEGLCRLKTPGEIATGVEIVSALHQRFGSGEYTAFLGWYIGRGLSSPDRGQLKTLSPEAREKEERERVSRQRVLLRVATELWLVCVLKSLEDVARPEEAVKVKEPMKSSDGPKSKSAAKDQADPEPFPLEALKDLLGHDREHVNLPLVVVFVKAFGWDILGKRTERSEERPHIAEDGSTVQDHPESGASTESEDVGPEDTPIIDTTLQQRFRNILKRYFEDVKTHVVKDQKQLNSQGKRNAEAYVKSGEVFEDRQMNFEKQTKSQEKLVANAQILADALGLDMPDLNEKESSSFGADGGIGLVKTGDYLRGQGDGAGIWEDEEERRFYENLVDLRERVPSILLDDPKKKKDEASEDGKATDGKPPIPNESSSETEKRPEASEDSSTTAIANKTVGAQVDTLLARLPELVTRDQTDQFAIDFCFLNSKASRNRLIRAISEIPKGRIDLLPVYSRLIATLSKCLPDVSHAVIAHLDEEFRSLQRRKSKDFLGQVRMINIRYIAELTKFGVVPEHVVFHCLKVALDDFSRMNIEIIGTFLENCGRYLLRNPDTSPRMVSFLDTLQRKKGAQHLGQQERMLIENAMYYVNPPERAAIQQKERNPLDLYVRKLIYLDLSKRNLEKTIKQLRKLHWEECEVPEMLRKIFTKPGKIKYGNVYLLAVMLGALYRYHQDFAISVMDELLEKITVGLEINEFKQNQKRIAEVKYLGELYSYRMIDSSLVFDTLYKLLNHGHPGGHVRPGVFCPIDAPDDFFRVRLVCALLETCGTYFDKGVLRRKLDFFLSYLQYYVYTKELMPMDIEFLLQDTFAQLRPQMKLVASFDEASQKFAEACRQNYQNAATTREPEPDMEELERAHLSDDGADDVEEDDTAAANGHSPSESETEETIPNEDADESEDEQIVVTRPEEQRDPIADAEFDREFAKMMSESVESRKFDRKQVFDVPLPMKRNAHNVASQQPADSDEAPVAAPVMQNGSMMKFALLSKKGNKQQTRAIDLPADSTFAVAMRSQQEAERAEQQRIKNLVLNYDLSATEEAGQDGTDPFDLLQPNLNRSRPTQPQAAPRSRRFSGAPALNRPEDSPLHDLKVPNQSTGFRTEDHHFPNLPLAGNGGGKKLHARMLRENENRRPAAPTAEAREKCTPAAESKHKQHILHSRN